MNDFAARLQAAYEAWNKSGGRTPDRFMALVTPDVEFRSILDTTLPNVSLAGPYRGKAGLFHYFAKMAENWELIETQTTNIVVGEKHVVWLGHETWRNLQTLRKFDNPKVQVWEIDMETKLASTVFNMVDTYGFADAVGVLASPELG
ncbi:hypothetical protein GRI39_09500 [Altererythrobacter indicus]|uniref:SnoaL-like domain-containing protein n=1 Tax=Altericroceibacterium indicum TaxID=374177 RepID=A0A845AA86_9SPHN|nr:nuclear transport factor 2 family protein [Altericroceibacterium indicum]MXP26269.1 hypothetical protein [Altericroceibacterium indicum]